VNNEDLYNCVAFLFIYAVHTNVCKLGGTTGQLLPLTLQEGVLGEWNKRLCAINPPVGQPDRLTPWVDEAVIIIRPALWYHPFSISNCTLALLVENIFW